MENIYTPIAIYTLVGRALALPTASCGVQLFSDLASSASSRKSKKPDYSPFSAPLQSFGCGPIASRRQHRHRGRNHASPIQKNKDHGDHWYIREKQGWKHRTRYDRIFQHAGQTGPGSAGECLLEPLRAAISAIPARRRLTTEEF